MIIMIPSHLTPLDTSPEKQRERALKKRGEKRKWHPRKNITCKKSCPIYGRCLFQEESFKKFNGKCGLANTPMADIKRHAIVKTLVGGKGEIFEVMRELLVELKTIARNDFKKKERVFECYDKLAKTEFGQKIEHSGSIGNINIQIVQPADVKEEKIIEGEVEENEK